MSVPSIRACALVVLAAMAASACTQPEQATPSLRVYEVPPARTDALGMALNDVFFTGKDQAPVGKASQRIPGKLLVLAPEAMHASIGETLGRLAAEDDDEPGARRAGNVQLRFWLLDAVPDDAVDASAAVPEAVRASLRRQFPDQAFRVYDQARLGIGGRHGTAQLQTAINTEIHVQAWEEGKGLLGDVSISTETPSGHALLQTRVALPIDEYVVLAVTGAEGGGASPPQRVFVVQATSG